MSDFPRPALGEPATSRWRALLIFTLVITVIFTYLCVQQVADSDAATLGYTVPSGLSEHATLCYPRQPVTESATSSNTELWIYWITEQNADFCNLATAERSEQKAQEESLRTEVKTVANNSTSLKTELEAVKKELANVIKTDESVNNSVVALGTEAKPLYVRTPPAEPTSKVEVANFTAGAQTDLSEIQQNLETAIWCLIGTLVAAMVTTFLFLILKPSR